MWGIAEGEMNKMPGRMHRRRSGSAMSTSSVLKSAPQSAVPSRRTAHACGVSAADATKSMSSRLIAVVHHDGPGRMMTPQNFTSGARHTTGGAAMSATAGRGMRGAETTTSYIAPSSSTMVAQGCATTAATTMQTTSRRSDDDAHTAAAVIAGHAAAGHHTASAHATGQLAAGTGGINTMRVTAAVCTTKKHIGWGAALAAPLTGTASAADAACGTAASTAVDSAAVINTELCAAAGRRLLKSLEAAREMHSMMTSSATTAAAAAASQTNRLDHHHHGDSSTLITSYGARGSSYDRATAAAATSAASSCRRPHHHDQRPSSPSAASRSASAAAALNEVAPASGGSCSSRGSRRSHHDEESSHAAAHNERLGDRQLAAEDFYVRRCDHGHHDDGVAAAAAAVAAGNVADHAVSMGRLHAQIQRLFDPAAAAPPPPPSYYTSQANTFGQLAAAPPPHSIMCHPASGGSDAAGDAHPRPAAAAAFSSEAESNVAAASASSGSAMSASTSGCNASYGHRGPGFISEAAAAAAATSSASSSSSLSSPRQHDGRAFLRSNSCTGPVLERKREISRGGRRCVSATLTSRTLPHAPHRDIPSSSLSGSGSRSNPSMRPCSQAALPSLKRTPAPSANGPLQGMRPAALQVVLAGHVPPPAASWSPSHRHSLNLRLRDAARAARCHVAAANSLRTFPSLERNHCPSLAPSPSFTRTISTWSTSGNDSDIVCPAAWALISPHVPQHAHPLRSAPHLQNWQHDPLPPAAAATSPSTASPLAVRGNPSVSTAASAESFVPYKGSSGSSGSNGCGSSGGWAMAACCKDLQPQTARPAGGGSMKEQLQVVVTHSNREDLFSPLHAPIPPSPSNSLLGKGQIAAGAAGGKTVPFPRELLRSQSDHERWQSRRQHQLLVASIPTRHSQGSIRTGTSNSNSSSSSSGGGILRQKQAGAGMGWRTSKLTETAGETAAAGAAKCIRAVGGLDARQLRKAATIGGGMNRIHQAASAGAADATSAGKPLTARAGSEGAVAAAAMCHGGRLLRKSLTPTPTSASAAATGSLFRNACMETTPASNSGSRVSGSIPSSAAAAAAVRAAGSATTAAAAAATAIPVARHRHSLPLSSAPVWPRALQLRPGSPHWTVAAEVVSGGWEASDKAAAVAAVAVAPPPPPPLAAAPASPATAVAPAAVAAAAAAAGFGADYCTAQPSAGPFLLSPRHRPASLASPSLLSPQKLPSPQRLKAESEVLILKYPSDSDTDAAVEPAAAPAAAATTPASLEEGNSVSSRESSGFSGINPQGPTSANATPVAANRSWVQADRTGASSVGLESEEALLQERRRGCLLAAREDRANPMLRMAQTAPPRQHIHWNAASDAAVVSAASDDVDDDDGYEDDAYREDFVGASMHGMLSATPLAPTHHLSPSCQQGHQEDASSHEDSEEEEEEEEEEGKVQERNRLYSCSIPEQQQSCAETFKQEAPAAAAAALMHCEGRDNSKRCLAASSAGETTRGGHSSDVWPIMPVTCLEEMSNADLTALLQGSVAMRDAFQKQQEQEEHQQQICWREHQEGRYEEQNLQEQQLLLQRWHQRPPFACGPSPSVNGSAGTTSTSTMSTNFNFECDDDDSTSVTSPSTCTSDGCPQVETPTSATNAGARLEGEKSGLVFSRPPPPPLQLPSEPSTPYISPTNVATCLPSPSSNSYYVVYRVNGRRFKERVPCKPFDDEDERPVTDEASL